MEQISEGHSTAHFSSPSSSDEGRCIKFDSVVTVVDGLHLGREAAHRKVAIRKVSLPLSFSRPSPQDLDDPAFTPAPQRKLSFRMPSITRAVPSVNSTSSTAGPSSGSNTLRSCLAGSSSPTPTDGRRKAGRRSASSDSPSHEIPSVCSATSSFSSSLPSTSHMSTSPPAAASSSFMQHVPFRRNSNTSTAASSTMATTPPAEDGLGPAETLLECCAACYKSVELGWVSPWEDAPWSASALRKKDRDEQERLEQEREFGRSVGVVGVLQKGRECTLPGSMSEDVDGAEVEGLCEKAKGVLVDEVSMARRASQVLSEDDEAAVTEAVATSPTTSPLSRCPFYTRKSSSSSILSLSNTPGEANGRASPPTTPSVTVTTSSYPSRNAPSTLAHRRTPSNSSLRVPLPSSPLSGSQPNSPLGPSPSLAAPVWVLGGDDGPSSSPSSEIYPPSPLSINGDITSPSGAPKDSFFPTAPANGTRRSSSPLPPSSYKPPSPPLEATLQSAATIKPKLQISTTTPLPTPPPTAPTAFMVLPVALPPRTRSQSNAPSPPPAVQARADSVATRTRSASVPKLSPPALSPGEQPGSAGGNGKKIKGIWGMLKGGMGMPSAAAGQVGVRGF